MTIVEEIKKLKEEKDAVILAHYYVRPEVQEIADYIGDSFYLSKVATKLKEQTIVFCGVSFMGESAKILNPKKISTFLLIEFKANPWSIQALMSNTAISCSHCLPAIKARQI